jgi:hypothetical protein
MTQLKKLKAWGEQMRTTRERRTLINRWLSPLQINQNTVTLNDPKDLYYFDFDRLKNVTNNGGITVIIPPGTTSETTSRMLKILACKIDAARFRSKKV